VVLIGSPGRSPAGQISGVRLAQGLRGTTLNTVIRALENARKPVVAGDQWRLHGRRTGAGHGLPLPRGRKGAQIALREVKLGLMPGAGGTPAPARLIGAERRST